MTRSVRPPVAGPRRLVRASLSLITILALVLSGCAAASSAPTQPIEASPEAAESPAAPRPSPVPVPSGTIRLYTSVTQSTVDAVVAGYQAAHPGVTVDVFRAPTGELAARIAAELRDGRILGDVLWLTDPLSIQAYAGQDLLLEWQPVEAAGIGESNRGESYWGTRFLNMVIVAGAELGADPLAWSDLSNRAYRDAVAIPDPGFAGSAFGALGYFALSTPDGLDFYADLKANGAVQVKTPDEVTAGVAEGRFRLGMTLDNSARTAAAKGSPVSLVWPTDGAIAMYSPIGVVAATENAVTAESFVEFVLSDPGQVAIAGTGWQPMRASAGGPTPGGSQVYPDWERAFGRQDELLEGYRAIFGG